MYRDNHHSQFRKHSPFVIAMSTTMFILIAMVLLQGAFSQLIEAERLAEYKKRNYSWPLTAVNPNTEGWKRRMFRRLAQVERVQNDDDRYNAWMAVMAAAITAKNFTESGWGLARAPPEVINELKESLHMGLSTAKEEPFINVIEGGERPLFIDQHELNEKVLEALRPMHEEWAGVPLQGSLAYGLRVYRNSSRLYMHVDKRMTHVISCILHVDHSPDSEPWPIFIEDFQGNTNEVILESGDILFYESSKCIHGRPKRFNGSWYSSLFVHYRPVEWNLEAADLETHYAIPSHWYKPEPLDPRLEEMVMVGTSMKEPECPEEWCGTKDSVKWYGPGIEGKVISTGFKDDIDASRGDEL